MLKFISGDIFESQADILVCPVNCVGVMGKGLAKAFKERFKGLFIEYKSACEYNRVRIVTRADTHYAQGLLWQNVLCVPTKKHWKNASEIEWIDLALDYIRLFLCFAEKKYSIAIPALGCGCGELNWADVKPLFEKHLSDLPNDIYVYEPIYNTVS